jgi:intracellular septation protein
MWDNRGFMKFVFDLFPVVLFFVAFQVAKGSPEQAAAIIDAVTGTFGIAATTTPAQAPVLLATLVAIAATLLQVATLLVLRRKVDRMMWVSLALIVVFGGATLALHDDLFIKWKPTVLYWLFAGTLAGAELLFGKNIIKAMMGEQVQMPDVAWKKLNLSWILFFALMGVANLVVAFGFSTETWVNFKLFGGIGLMLVFVLAQGLFLSRYVEEKGQS